jgi:hypothetical protein
MYKVLMLPVYLFSLAVMADMNNEACLGIQKMPTNQLAFFYTSQDKAGAAYFYAKVMPTSGIAETTADTILGMGENLRPVPNTNPHYYQIPDHAKKLYLVRSKASLSGVDPLARIIPVNNTQRDTRNVGIFSAPLPAETTQSVNGVPVNVCEIVLN